MAMCVADLPLCESCGWPRPHSPWRDAENGCPGCAATRELGFKIIAALCVRPELNAIGAGFAPEDQSRDVRRDRQARMQRRIASATARGAQADRTRDGVKKTAVPPGPGGDWS